MVRVPWRSCLSACLLVKRCTWGTGRFLAAIILTRQFFNYSDLPCYMTIEEIKSLIRLPDIIACAKQNITTLEISARKGTGLAKVLHWLQDEHRSSR